MGTKLKFLMLICMFVFFISFASAEITYNENFVKEDEKPSQGYVVTKNNGGTDVAYSDDYTAYFDYFDDNPSVNDAVYIGSMYEQIFTGFKTNNFDPIISDSHTLVWEYYNGSNWTEFSNVTDIDGTLSNFTSTGSVGWNKPKDWEKTTIEGRNYYWFRIRLANFTNITEGGRQTSGYYSTRPAMIYLSNGESTTPSDLKTMSDNNGWDTVDYENDVYIFKDGMYTDGSVTFTANDVDIQIGTPERYGYFGFANEDTLKFNPKDGDYRSSQYINFLKLYAPRGFNFIRGDSNSEFNNMLLKNMENRLSVKSDGSFYNTNLGNSLPFRSPSFERVNFNNIDYILTTPAAVYNNIYFRGSFSVDPTYQPVISNSVFDSDGGSEFMSRYFPNSKDHHHFFKAIDCEWTQGNKFDFDTGSYPLEDNSEQNLRHIYSHNLNLKITDKNGNEIPNVTVTLTDKYGNTQIFEEIENSYVTQNYLMSDNEITVNNGSNYEVNKYYKLSEEIMKVTSISGDVLTVERGLFNTTPYRGYAEDSIPLYERKNSTLTNSNGSIEELEVIEYAFFRYGDGTGAYETEYTYYPYNITIEKEGYETYTQTFNLTEKTDWTISLEERDWNYSQTLLWKILNKEKRTVLKLSEDGNLAVAGEVYEDTNTPPPSENILFSMADKLWLTNNGDLYLANKLIDLLG